MCDPVLGCREEENMSTQQLRRSFTALMTVALVTVVHAEPPKYIFKDITPKTLGGYPVLGCKATGIARNGLIAGQAWVTGLNKSVGWTLHNGQYQMIDHDYGSAIITTTGCNSKGQVIGYRDTPTSGERAFVSVNGKFVDLPTGPNPDTNALAINDDGTIVGYGWDSNNSMNPAPGAIWRNGQYSELDSRGKNGVPAGAASSINASGLIAGLSADPSNGFWRATVWRDGTREFVGPEVTGNYATQIRNVSDSGLMSGLAFRYEPTLQKQFYDAFTIDQNGFRVLNKFGRQFSNAGTISGKGRIAGAVWDESGGQVVNGVVGMFEGDGYYPLEDLVINKDPNFWTPRGFTFQPQQEHLVGSYFNELGNLQAFSAEAVPEAETLICLGLGFLTTLMRKNKTR